MKKGMTEKEIILKGCESSIRSIERLAEKIIKREKSPYYAALLRDIYDLGIRRMKEKHRRKELL